MDFVSVKKKLCKNSQSVKKIGNGFYRSDVTQFRDFSFTNIRAAII